MIIYVLYRFLESGKLIITVLTNGKITKKIGVAVRIDELC
jgi:hypothetical protein